MPTLEDLFRQKEIGPNGQTAEKKYDIRNSKDIRISSSNPLINISGMLLARGARSLVGIRQSESLLEEEVVGLRIIRTGSIPFIYGTDLPRITLRTTDALSKMKEVTSGQLADTGAIGAKATSLVNNTKSKLGLPTLATPTYVVGELNKTDKYDLKQVPNRMIDLGKIKDSAEGTELGKFLKGLGGGNLQTLGRQALGSAIKLGKSAIRKKLFGSDKRLGIQPSKSAVYIDPINGETSFTKDSFDKFYRTYGIGYGGNFESTASPEIEKSPTKNFESVALNKNGTTYTNLNNINPLGDTPADRKDLSLKQQIDYEPVTEWRNSGGDIPPLTLTRTPDRIPKFSPKATLIDLKKEEFLENSNRGMLVTSDRLNKSVPIKGEFAIDSTTGKKLDDIDFVTLKFQLIDNDSTLPYTTVYFKSTISGLTETFSPSWDSAKFIGSAFNYYTYSGIERSVSFNFKVYSLSANEHKTAWNRLNFLSSLVYPTRFSGGAGAVVPPFIYLTLGSMYKKKEGFIESLTYTIDDNTPWQIGNTEVTIPSSTGAAKSDVAPRGGTADMKDYTLPMIVDVAITVKFVESRKTVSDRKFYPFRPLTGEIL
jgi:hypothetical protein